jgi:hypothetical protein
MFQVSFVLEALRVRRLHPNHKLGPPWRSSCVSELEFHAKFVFFSGLGVRYSSESLLSCSGSSQAEEVASVSSVLQGKTQFVFRNSRKLSSYT